MFQPPTFPGMSAHQQTLCHVTHHARLDVIVNNNASLDEAYTEASTTQNKTPVETRPAQEVTPQHGNWGTKESPTKKLKLTPPATPSEATKDNPGLEATPTWANGFLPGGDVLCDILGEKYDLSDPETVWKADKILCGLV